MLVRTRRGEGREGGEGGKRDRSDRRERSRESKTTDEEQKGDNNQKKKLGEKITHESLQLELGLRWRGRGSVVVYVDRNILFGYLKYLK